MFRFSAVNGSWSTWSAWSECSTTCDVGIKSRVRNCTNPAPQHGGKDCDGKSKNETSCYRKPCEGELLVILEFILGEARHIFHLINA